MITLTYGTLPSKAEFRRLWAAKENGPGFYMDLNRADCKALACIPSLMREYTGASQGDISKYHFHFDNADVLYAWLARAIAVWNEASHPVETCDHIADIASSVLFYFGVQWV